MRFFQNCTTKEEVKKLYRDLAKEFHPDHGGDLQTMQAINSEYSFAIAALLKGENLTSEEVEAEILNAEQYKEAVNTLINLPGLILELCGGWLWISGNTYQHKEVFKQFNETHSNKFFWARVKKCWYFRSPEYKTANKKTMEMDEIRRKYGSQLINAANYSKQKFIKVA